MFNSKFKPFVCVSKIIVRYFVAMSESPLGGLLSVTVSKGTNIKKRKKSKKAKNQQNGKSKAKRAPSAYNLYVKAERKGVAEANPGASFGEITRLASHDLPLRYKRLKYFLIVNHHTTDLEFRCSFT